MRLLLSFCAALSSLRPLAAATAECRLFLAESTIPHGASRDKRRVSRRATRHAIRCRCLNTPPFPVSPPTFSVSPFVLAAGLGIFTGVDLREGDAVAEPDIVVPLQDWEWHAAADADFHFLWGDYSWEASEAAMDGDMDEGYAIVLGTGCMVSSVLLSSRFGRRRHRGVSVVVTGGGDRCGRGHGHSVRLDCRCGRGGGCRDGRGCDRDRGRGCCGEHRRQRGVAVAASVAVAVAVAVAVDVDVDMAVAVSVTAAAVDVGVHICVGAVAGPWLYP